MFRLRVSWDEGRASTCFDVYVDGQFWKATQIPADTQTEIDCFSDVPCGFRDVSIYLPLRHEVRIDAWAVDHDAVCERPTTFTEPPPILLYGSSIAQGVGAFRAGMSYIAILSRVMVVDHVNMRSGGAGKAVAEIVTRASGSLRRVRRSLPPYRPCHPDSCQR